jgi:hypothetical protein
VTPSVPGRRALAITGALILTLPLACLGDEASLSASGRGLPQVTLEFPETSAAGSVETATLTITNPGPGDVSRLAVAFALVGAPATEGLPTPLVDATGPGPPAAVLEVRPRPASASDDGVYRFTGLREGGSVTIAFALRIPRRAGVAANSVVVYDDVDPERARGLRLETTVRG